MNFFYSVQFFSTFFFQGDAPRCIAESIRMYCPSVKMRLVIHLYHVLRYAKEESTAQPSSTQLSSSTEEV